MMRNMLIIAAIFIMMGCGGKSSTPTPPAPVPSPGNVVLTDPAQNAVCITGNVISDTESSVLFSWNASSNTNSYSLVLKNLLTATSTTQNTNNTQLTLTLLRNTPYSWYIISTSTKTTKTGQSDTWKFYNAGPGVVTYAPFPADITSPTLGEMVTTTSGTIDLKWAGSSVNPGTIVNYDVYFGTTNTPTLLKSMVTNSFLDNVSVTSGTTYYWKVITRDIQGDTSDSGLYQFTVN